MTPASPSPSDAADHARAAMASNTGRSIAAGAGALRHGWVIGVLVAVGAWHAVGLWQRWRRPDPDAAVALLRAGAVDREDRRRCLEVLRDAAAGEASGRVLALAAAIALEDRAAFARLLQGAGPERSLFTGVGPRWPEAEDVARRLVGDASFGEHGLAHLFLGQWLRAGSDPRAAAELEAAARGARWSGATLAGEMAAAALGALPPDRR